MGREKSNAYGEYLVLRNSFTIFCHSYQASLVFYRKKICFFMRVAFLCDSKKCKSNTSVCKIPTTLCVLCRVYDCVSWKCLLYEWTYLVSSENSFHHHKLMQKLLELFKLHNKGTEKIRWVWISQKLISSFQRKTIYGLAGKWFISMQTSIFLSLFVSNSWQHFLEFMLFITALLHFLRSSWPNPVTE